MRLYSFIIILATIGIQALGQSSAELAKKNIKTYLSKNLNDETSYKSVGWSKLDTVWSQLEEDGEYKHYKTFIDEATEENKTLLQDAGYLVDGINRDSISFKRAIADSIKHYEQYKEYYAAGNYGAEKYDIDRLKQHYKDAVSNIRIRIKESDAKGNNYIKAYNENAQNIEKAKVYIDKRIESFKSEVIGYYICHQYRAKNIMGALINTTRCFTLNSKYHITNVD